MKVFLGILFVVSLLHANWVVAGIALFLWVLIPYRSERIDQ